MYKIIVYKDNELQGEAESDCFVLASKNFGGVLLGRAPGVEDTELAAGAIHCAASLLESIQQQTTLPKQIIEAFTFMKAEMLNAEYCDSFAGAVKSAHEYARGRKNGIS